MLSPSKRRLPWGFVATGPYNLARIGEIAAVAVIEATAKQRSVRCDKRNQLAAIQRFEHQTGDVGDRWYHFLIKHTPVWRGPAQIATVNWVDGNAAVIFQGGSLDRRHQEVRAHVPYSVSLSVVVGHDVFPCNTIRQKSRVCHHRF